MPFAAGHDAGAVAPVIDLGGAASAGHVKARQADKVRCADLNACVKTALKVEVELEAVVHFIVGYVLKSAEDAFNPAVVNYAEHLVDEMDAPVIKHSAAVLLVASPVAGDAT